MIILKSIIDNTLGRELKHNNKSLYEIIKLENINNFELFVFNGETQINDFDYIPKDEDFIEIFIKPAGGNDKTRNILGSILAVGLGAWGGAGLAGWALGKLSISATGFAGVLATTATKGMITAGLTKWLVKPAKPVKSEFKQDPRNYTLSGQSNELRKYDVIPDVYGKVRMFPPLAAQPYTEISGNDQFLRMLFTCGFGRVDISDIKIGDTDISNYSDYEIEILEGNPATDPDLTLYTDDIFQENVNTEIVYNETATYTTKTTQADTDEIIIDFSFPNGLFKIENTDAKQRKLTNEVGLVLQYKLTSGSTWNNIPDLAITEHSENITLNPSFGPETTQPTIAIIDSSTSNLYSFVRISSLVLGGKNQFDIRIANIRQTNDSSYTTAQTIYWDNLKSIESINPVNRDDISLIALKIKATDQLNGTLEKLNCIVQRYVPVYDGVSSWVDTISRNPAWAFANILRGNANSKPITDDTRFDLDQLLTLETFCDNNSFNFDFSFDGRTNVSDALDTVLASCRSEKTLIDGKYSVVIDKENTTVQQVLTPKNIISFQANKTFQEEVHALKCYFINEEEGYEQDERIVYNDGYNESNATNIEDYRIPGIVNKDHIWKLARYLLATQKLRPYIYLYKMDIENLILEKGSRIEIQHDILKIGIANDRIKSFTTNAGYVETITVAENFPMITGTSYAIRIRKNNGESQVFEIDTVDGDNTTITLTTPFLLSGFTINNGDLIAFGEADKITRSLLVKSIKFNGDFVADLECVDYNEDIYTADQGTIPSFVSNITETYEERNEIPEAPVIARIASDSFVLGLNTNNKFQTRILIDLKPQSRKSIIAQFYECRFRKTDSSDNWTYISEIKSDAAKVIINDVDNGIDYDIQLRSKYKNNVSDWTETTSYTVIGKDIPPDSPTNLSSDFSTRNLILSWNHVKELETDLDYYEIRRFATDVGFDSATYFAETRKNTITIDMLEKYGTSGADGYYYYIKAVDQAGNYSTNEADFGSIGNSAPTMPSVTYDFDTKDLKLSWEHDETEDFSYYLVNILNTSNILKESYKINNSEFIFTYDENVRIFGTPTRSFKIQVGKFDVFNQLDPSPLTTVTNSAPLAPTNVSITEFFNSLRGNWDKLSDADIVGYNLYFSTSATPDYFKTIGNTSFNDINVNDNLTYYFRVSANDWFGEGSLSSIVSGTAKQLETKDYNLDTFLTDGIDFSVNGSNQAEWTSGTLSHKGTLYNITGATTIDKYIYFDPSISTTLFQTSSTKPAVGLNVGLMAVFDSTQLEIFPAQNNRIQHAGLLQADTITAEEIITGGVTAKHVLTNEIITDEANIANAVINTAHIDKIYTSKLEVGDDTSSYTLNEALNPLQINDADLTDRADLKNFSMRTAKKGLYPEGYSTIIEESYELISNGSNLVVSKDFIEKGINIEKTATNKLTSPQSLFLSGWTSQNNALIEYFDGSDNFFFGYTYAKVTFDGTINGQVIATYTGALNDIFSVYLKSENDILVALNNGDYYNTSGEWERVTGSNTTGTSNTAVIRDSFGIVQTIYIGFAQIENSDYPTSFVEGGTTRPAGSLIYSTDIISKNEGSILFNFKPKFNYDGNFKGIFSDENFANCSISWNPSNKYFYLYANSATRITLPSITDLSLLQSNIKILLTYDGTTVKMFQNGIKSSSDYLGTLSWGDIIYLGGSQSGANRSDSTFKEIQFFNRALTEDEAKKLTALVDYNMIDNSQQSFANCRLSSDGVEIRDINNDHIIDAQGTTIYNSNGELAYKSGIKASLEVVGAINNGAGYSAGVSTVTVDGFTTALNINDLFFFGNQTTIYTVTSATTTSISFTPTLAYAVLDNEQISAFNENGLSILNGSINIINSDDNVKLVIDPSEYIYLQKQNGSDDVIFAISGDETNDDFRVYAKHTDGYCFQGSNNSDTFATIIASNADPDGVSADLTGKVVIDIDPSSLDQVAIETDGIIKHTRSSGTVIGLFETNSFLVGNRTLATMNGLLNNWQGSIYYDSDDSKFKIILQNGSGTAITWTQD